MSEVLLVTRGRKLNPTALLGLWILVGMFLLCVVTLPWTLGRGESDETRYYDRQYLDMHHAPPQLGTPEPTDPLTPGQTIKTPEDRFGGNLPPAWHAWMGTDNLGRPMLARCLLGGAISLGIGLSAAAISVFIGTLWGLFAGYMGGRTDSFMMRIVDVLYGLPYILLVLLLVVALDGAIERFKSSYNEKLQPPGTKAADGSDESPQLKAQREYYRPLIEKHQEAVAQAVAARTATKGLAEGEEKEAKLAEAERLEKEAEKLDPRPAMLVYFEQNIWVVNLGSLLVAIGSVSWLTLARVVRGQVLSLKAQPFVEAARATGCSTPRILMKHLLPNLLGPVIVYTTLTVPQAILQESFLSFLGIGVKLPLPSWGNLASEGLKELNNVKSYWWLLAWPCLLLAVTLLSLNFLGDGLRDKYDPRSKR